MVPALSDLAERILTEHQSVVDATVSALDHALAAGKLLLEAKDVVGHGNFGRWLATNFQRDGRRLSARTARAYMQVAKRWPELQAKRQRIADLSFRNTLQLLAETMTSEPALPPQTEIPLPDLQAGYRYLGHGPSDVDGFPAVVAELTPSAKYPGCWYEAFY